MTPDEPISYTPLYEAQNAARYERQMLISEYETNYDCSLIVISSPIFSYSVVFFEELIHNANPEKDLHVMLTTPGGDGETALRLIRPAQSRCKSLKVVVPAQAKSAGTVFALGAHTIIMGAISDLGPVDPQFQLESQSTLVSAKDIIGAVEHATAEIQKAPETYPLWASMLSNVTALMVQQTSSALARSNTLLRDALASNPDRQPSEVELLVVSLTEKLIDEPSTHTAVFGPDEASAAGPPVEKLELTSDHWRAIWKLWTRYALLGSTMGIYEGGRASQVFPLS